MPAPAPALALALAIAAVPASGQEPKKRQPLMSFGVLTDVRYADREPADGLHHRTALARLEDCLADARERKLSFITQLGNLSNNNRDDLAGVLRVWRAATTDSPVPVINDFHVLGIRDLAGVRSTKQRNEVLRMLHAQRGYYHFSRSGWHFVFLDGTDLSLHGREKGSRERREAERVLAELKARDAKNARPENGGIGRRQLDWLRGALASATEEGAKAVIFCHFPILPAASSPAHVLWHHERILQLIESYPCVFAWFSGHHLEARYAMRKGIHHVTFQGMVTAPKKNAYAVVDAYANRLEVNGIGRQPSLSLPVVDRRSRVLATTPAHTIPDPKDPFVIPTLQVVEGKPLRLLVRDGQPFALTKPKGSHSIGIGRYLSSVGGRLVFEPSKQGMIVSPRKTGVVDLEVVVRHADGREVVAPMRLQIRPRGATPRVLFQRGAHTIVVRKGEVFRVRVKHYTGVLDFRAKDAGLAVLDTHRVPAETRKADYELDTFLDKGYGDVNGATVRAVGIGTQKLVEMLGIKGKKANPWEIPVLVCPVMLAGPLTVQLLSAHSANNFHALPRSLQAGVRLRIENPRENMQSVEVFEILQRTVDKGKKKLERRVEMERKLSVPPRDTREFHLRLPKIEGGEWNDRQVEFVVVLLDSTGKRSELVSWTTKVGQVH